MTYIIATRCPDENFKADHKNIPHTSIAAVLFEQQCKELLSLFDEEGIKNIFICKGIKLGDDFRILPYAIFVDDENKYYEIKCSKEKAQHKPNRKELTL